MPAHEPAIGFLEALGALRRPLDFAARDNFGHLDVVRDLGQSLAQAAARLEPHLGKPLAARLSAWARDVARWSVLPRTERERLVAAGLRLCATAGLDAPPEPRARPEAPRRFLGLATLGAPLLGLPGVGPVIAERLSGRGLASVGNLCTFCRGAGRICASCARSVRSRQASRSSPPAGWCARG